MLFRSQFHFHIAHIAGKQNLVADALSRRPMANSISIAHNHDLTSMIDMYAQDEDFAQVIKDIESNVPHEPYTIKEGFLMHGLRLCITKNLWKR